MPNITTQNLVPAGVATAGSSVPTRILGYGNTLTIQVSGTYTGALSVQGTVDGINWITLGGTTLIVNMATGATAATIASGATGIYQVGVSGLDQIRVTALAAVTGTAVVTVNVVAGVDSFDTALPSGTNTIGAVTVTGTTTDTPTNGTAYTYVTAASTNLAVIKAAAGNLHELTASNTTAAIIYVKLYNKATAPVVASDVPVLTLPVAIGAMEQIDLGPIGKRFPLGIAHAITGAAIQTDATNTAAGAQVSATYL